MTKDKKIEPIKEITMRQVTFLIFNGENQITYLGRKGEGQIVDKINEIIAHLNQEEK